MSDKSIPTDFFFVVAKQTKDGRALTSPPGPGQQAVQFKIVYYGIDGASGYPYWSDSLRGADFMTLDKASKAYNQLLGTDGEATRLNHGILQSSIKIVEIVLNVREDIDPVAIERSAIINKLSAREREILRV